MQFPGCWGHWCRFGSQKAQYKWTEQIIDFASCPQAAWPAGVNGAGAVVGFSPPIMQHEQNDVRQKRKFMICVAEPKDSDMNSSSPPQFTIGILCISLDRGLFSHFHELHCEINSLKTVLRAT